MLDLIVLFTLFCGLVGVLVVAHYWMVFKRASRNPVASKRLLDEWLQAHNLNLPNVQCILSVLNRQLQEIESEDWEKLELTHLLPKTELPVFGLFKAELSPDNRDITLCCDVEWPMCLPGVGVAVLEKGVEQPIICHFMIDWMNAEMEVTLSELNSTLMLSSKNTQPFRMGVACMVAEGSAKDPEKMASSVADSLQQMLMDLQLHRVPLVPVYNHTPLVPLVLVSTPDEPLSAPQDDEDEALTNETPSELEHELAPAAVDESNVTSHPVAVATAADIITPIIEEVEPLEREATPSPLRPLSLEVAKTEVEMSNGSPPQVERNLSEPISAHKQVQIEANPKPPSTASPGEASTPISPGWRRTPSYDNLEEISVPLTSSTKSDDVLNTNIQRRSNSTDFLASPSHLASSPSGKALSMSGSEAESIYGADDRIPSTLIFEVNDSLEVRHIVALSTMHASKLRRRFPDAKKFHVYNDHSFMATHLKNRTECVVCRQKISKLFGKQGYTCRDCDMVVHKQCHWKVEDHCTSSTVPSMNLIYPNSTSVTNL